MMTSDYLVESWPLAPSNERPKALFVDFPVAKRQEEFLLCRGWVVLDVRVLPNKTDADRAEGLKAMLEGVRVGSIAPEKEKMRWVELEAKVYGLLTGKDKLADKSSSITPEVLDSLLNFGKKASVA